MIVYPRHTCAVRLENSSIDLTLYSQVLLPNFTWKVTDDLCGSDHFPIIFSSTQPSSTERPRKWKLSKADWNKFETLCQQTFARDKFENCDDPIKLFTSLLLDAAKASIPQTPTNPKRPDKPWYNDECKQAVKDRKDAKRVENTVGKGEIARYEQFLLFPKCFQKTCTVDT